MNAQVEKENSQETLILLTTLIECEAAFSRELFATLHDKRLKRKLVGSAAKDLAIFFYLLRLNQVNSPDLIVKAARSHNVRIDTISTNDVFLDMIGKTRAQIISSKFSDRGLLKLADNFGTANQSIDQSDISRFLVLQMSPESCRSVIELFDHAGMLERTKVMNGSTLVRSTGKVEEIFGSYLNNLGEKLKDLYRR